MNDLERYLRAVTHLRGEPPSGFRYGSLESYFLAEGHAYESGPLDDLAGLLAAIPRRARFPLGMCFRNAMRFVLDRLGQGIDDGHVLYAEGYATTGLLPVQHAWLDVGGRVVDLTWRRRDGRHRGRRLGSRVFGALPEGWAYYGRTFAAREVLEHVTRRGVWWSLVDDIEGGFERLRERPEEGVEERHDRHEGGEVGEHDEPGTSLVVE